MDKKKLETKLTEIAEWAYPSLSLDNTIERLVPTTGRKEYKQVFTPKPDLGPRIIAFKKNIGLNPCAWCNKMVKQQTYHYKTFDIKNKTSTWHHECLTCQRVYNPQTGELIYKNNKRAKAIKQQKLAWYNDPNYKG